MSQRIECVALTCFSSEFSTLAAILVYSGIRLYRAETLEEADFYLTVTGATVFLTDVTFLDGTWRDALRMTAETHPPVAALVAAEEVDCPGIADAYKCGACGILWKPVDFIRAIDLIRTVDQAARDRAQWLGERICSAPASNPCRQIPEPGLPPRNSAGEPEYRTHRGAAHRR